MKLFILLMGLLATSQAILLDCTYSVTGAWNVLNVYSCTGKVVFSSDPRAVVEITKNHLAGKTNDDVLGVVIRDKAVKFIPRHIGAFFPNLESLDMLNSGVEEISRADFAGLPKLRQLYMQGNEVKVLENDLFKRNPKLKWISFYTNPIAHVGHDVFKNLDDLVSIFFHGSASTCYNSYSQDNREATLTFISKLVSVCPPTFEMTFEKVKEGILKEVAKGKIIQFKSLNEEKIESDQSEMFELKRTLNDHENRLTKLENDQKLKDGEF